ncbi:Ankyrin repeat-containing domain protein [Akanthomyces lecanii RCEF 1005]|uniref:Ankyrin repeat-containing domain protein n=1 Tax=Akanthomyces lecanii RCEF 1005 TaxID=1081108 RepID=A0A168IY09_CORDF|nr:Ankyrin repeat-containing domain protein [Akanthomyces lecanii RCEF 1005]
MSAPEIPEEEWDSHKDVIVKYFREFTAKRLLQYLKDNHGFCPTSSQLESRLKKWKLRKNVHKKQWQGISASDQRNLENGSGVVTVDGVIVDRKKWMRAKKWAHQQQPAPVQAECALQRDEDGAEVRTPSKEVGICTDVTSDTPFSQFDTKFSINKYLIMAASERAHNITYVATQIETERCNTFWVLGVCINTHTPPADAFASVLLVSAASLNDFATCRWLLERGANPKAIALSSGDENSTALLEAVWQRHGELVGLLVDKGADVNMGGEGELLPSPLVEAVLSESPQSSRVKISQILVNKGADIHQVVEHGDKESTLLNFVVGTGDVEVAAIFLQSNVAIESFPKQHPTPLQVAVQAGEMELVEMLLKAGFDVNERASAGSVGREIVGTEEWCICTVLTPLQVALAENNLVVATVLLRERANVNGFDVSKWLNARKYRTISTGPLSDDNCCCMSRQDLRATSSPLQLAALSRSVSMGRLLLKLGATVNFSGGFCTALQLAVRQKGNLAFVKLLLENGANVNAPAPEPQGRTALQAAVELGDRDIIELLLRHRADVNAFPSFEGFTALQAAVLRGDPSLVSQLIDYGADVNAPAAAENGRTALQAAVAAGNLDIIHILLQKGASILAPRALTGGCSAIEAALKQPLALNAILLYAEAERNLAIVQSEVDSHFPALCDDSYDEVVAVLFKYGIRLSNSGLQQALQIAVEKRNVALAKKCIDSGANARMCLEGPEGGSIITGLVATGSPEFCALFIKSQADLEGDRGTEALLVAVSNNDPHMMDFLLSKGASPNWNDACRSNRPSLVAKVFELLPSAERFPRQSLSKENMAIVLLRRGAKLNGVTFPGEVCYASLPMFRLLLEAGLEVNRRLRDQGSLLQFETNMQMEDVVELLLNAGADVNAPPAPIKSNTALQSAVDNENARLVRLFVSKGVDVNGPPSPEYGATALQRAVMVGSMPIFVLLLENGADVNAPAALVSGRTALEAAAEYGRLDMSHILLHKDKEPETLWLRCQRAATLAASHGFPILAREFREWKKSGFDKPWERDFYAQFEVSSR